MNLRSDLMLFARISRRSTRRLEQMLRWKRVSLHGLPVIFANSFPKSGTHLLTQALAGLPAVGPAVVSGLPAVVTFSGDSGAQRSLQAILKDLQRFLPGDLGYGHLHAIPEVVAYMRLTGVAGYFILRDPRDVVVSHVHYVTDMEPRHVHHAFYSQELKTFDERLRTSILGRPEVDVAFPDIGARLLPYLGWLCVPEVLVARFEDFIDDQTATVGRLLDHAVERGFPLAIDRKIAIERLIDLLDPHRSPTFRSGKAGGWRAAFTEENKRNFKEVAGDMLVQLGYEQDMDW